MQRHLILASLIVILFYNGLSSAGSITFDFGAPLTQPTNATQDTKLAALVARDNTQRAAQDPPLAARTIEQYLRDVLVNAVQSYVEQEREAETKDACAQWPSFSQAKKDQLIAAFEGKAPCR